MTTRSAPYSVDCRTAAAHPSGSLRILLHDYGPYAFTFDLAHYWTRLGHRVHLTHGSDVDRLRAPARRASHAGFEVTRIDAAANKYAFFSKPFADRKYGDRVARLIAQNRYDVVLSGNTPLNAQSRIAAAARRSGAAFIYWMHDYISRGIGVAAGKKLTRPAGAAAAAWYRRLEHRLLRSASAVVLASPQFREIAVQASVPADRSFVIENWCPLADIVPLEQDNAWSREHGLAGERVLLYSGTLGLKHEPSCFLTLAQRLTHTKVVVIAQGPGADWLRAQTSAAGPANLTVLPLEPYERLSEALASSTLLVAISDTEAASFCFPSKTLTYLTAGRPVLGIMPRECFAASLILSPTAGIVIPPAKLADSVDSIGALLDDRASLARMSAAARTAALARCDIETIGPAFDRVLARCARQSTP